MKSTAGVWALILSCRFQVTIMNSPPTHWRQAGRGVCGRLSGFKAGTRKSVQVSAVREGAISGCCRDSARACACNDCVPDGLSRVAWVMLPIHYFGCPTIPRVPNDHPTVEEWQRGQDLHCSYSSDAYSPELSLLWRVPDGRRAGAVLPRPRTRRFARSSRNSLSNQLHSSPAW